MVATPRKRNWLELPAVRERINRKVSGDPHIAIWPYAIGKYFQSRKIPIQSCLTLACAGELEREIAECYRPLKHRSIGLSQDQIDRSRKLCSDFPYIHFELSDLNRCQLPAEEVDLV